MMSEKNPWESAREEFSSIPLPPDLEEHLREGIRQGKKRRKMQTIRRTLGSCAACFLLMVGVLNLSPTVANAAADLPVVGSLFQVLTVRQFQDVDDDRTLTVQQPQIAGSQLSDRINQEIQERVDAKIAEGEAAIQEYKQAFLETGGTEEEWLKTHGEFCEINVDYEILYQSEARLSFVLDTYTSLYSFQQEQFFYNLDLSLDRELTLEDLLGENWVELCNESIREQMAEAEDPSVFFTEEEGGFVTVDENTQFYLNELGQPVVVFPRYTIAIGAMGIVEFGILP